MYVVAKNVFRFRHRFEHVPQLDRLDQSRLRLPREFRRRLAFRFRRHNQLWRRLNPNQRLLCYLRRTTETNFTFPSILSLAARRKGIARSAALHLDCARSAEGRSLSVAFEELLLFRSERTRSTLDREVAQRLRDSRFHPFQLLLRHRVSLGFFDEVI